MMVLFENFHVFNSQSEYESAISVPLNRNPILVVGVAAALDLYLMMMWVPPLQPILQTAPVAASEFIVLVIVASTVLVTIEAFKWTRARRQARAGRDNCGRAGVA